MQQQITQQQNATVAPDPTRKVMSYFFITCGVIIALTIGSYLLPEPLHDVLLWNKPIPFFNGIIFVTIYGLFLAPIILSAIFLVTFINMSFITPYTKWKWRVRDKKRQQMVENTWSDRSIFPLPEIFTALPTTVSICVRRNWRATRIAGAIYTPLIGIVLLVFCLDWQVNMSYLAQQGEISGWALLGGIFRALLYCLFIFPAISAFILAPRQRLIATQDGLICYRGLRFSYIPWQEASLFAVIEEQRDTLVYELSSSTSIIRWSSKPAWNYADIFPAATIGTAPLGLIQAENSTEQYQWQVRQLTAMVAAGTGLPLYDVR